MRRPVLATLFSGLLMLSVWGLAAPPAVRCHVAGAVGCPGGLLGASVRPAGSGDQYFQVTLYDYGFWIVDTTSAVNESSRWVLYEGYTIHLNVTGLPPDTSKGGSADHGLGIGYPINFAMSAPSGTWSTGSFVAPRSPSSGIELYCSHYCGTGHYGMYEDIVDVTPGANAPKPTASGAPLLGVAPLTVHFFSNSTGGVPPYSFGWDFGDGGAAATQNASHQYQFPGVYYARAVVRDSQNLTADSTPMLVNVTSPPTLELVANGTPTSGPAPLQVNFTATAFGGTPPYRYGWAFGDGSNVTGANVSHTYVEPGSYVATATATDHYGLSHPTAAVQISVTGTGGALGLSILVLPRSGDAPVLVNASTSIYGGTSPYGIVTWSWGDGSYGIGRTANHRYTLPGTFVVAASVSDSRSATARDSTDVVVASPPSVSIGVARTGNVEPQTVRLLANVTGGIPPYGPYRWSFGDNSTTVDGAAVQHVYAAAGDYRVVVTTNDSTGRLASTSSWVNLTPPSPAATPQVETSAVLGFLGATGVLGLVGLVAAARWEGRQRAMEIPPDPGPDPPGAPDEPTDGGTLADPEVEEGSF